MDEAEMVALAAMVDMMATPETMLNIARYR
jgi:hypothetical protein